MATIEYTRTFSRNEETRDFVQFSEAAVQNFPRSEAEGRPIFDTVEMITISFPGNNLTEIHEKVNDAHREKYGKQYEAFKKRGATVLNGTPLEAWTALTKAQVREFQAVNIFTVEQLAGLDDHGKQRIGMGGQMWSQRAKSFLEAAEDGAETDRLAAENFRLNEQVKNQAAQIAELGVILQNMQGSLQALQNARAQVDTTIPGVPQAALPAFAAAPTGGSLAADDNYIEPRRRGRPPKAQEAAA